MPDKYIKEMVADLIGASKAYGGNDATGYYEANKHKWCLHPETKEKFEKLLYEVCNEDWWFY